MDRGPNMRLFITGLLLSLLVITASGSQDRYELRSDPDAENYHIDISLPAEHKRAQPNVEQDINAIRNDKTKITGQTDQRDGLRNRAKGANSGKEDIQLSLTPREWPNTVRVFLPAEYQADEEGLLTRVERVDRAGIRNRNPPERDWPNEAKRFLPKEYQKDKTLNLLEALAWGIFKGRGIHQINTFDDLNTVRWKDNYGDWKRESFTNNDKIYEIQTIVDAVGQIWYHARYNLENQHRYMFYKLNNFIYRVTTKDMYVYLVGMVGKEDKPFKAYKAVTYDEILRVLQGQDKGVKFHRFCLQTFQNQECFDNCRPMVLGQYFMAAVFAESVRNFRQFSVFLLSSAACGPDPNNKKKCNLFVDKNPMARGGSWIQPTKRGFYGWDEIKKVKKVLDVENDTGKQYIHYIKSSAAIEKLTPEKILQILNNLKQLGEHDVVQENDFNNYCEMLRGCSVP